jgi:hypothetical protein
MRYVDAEQGAGAERASEYGGIVSRGLTGRPTLLGLSTLLLVLGMLVMAGAAGAKPRQTLDMKFTNARPAAPTGATVNPTWLGDHPGEKPHTITSDSFTFANGSKLDFSVPTECTATDGQLERQGASACSKSSRVGEGEVDLDVGRPFWIIPRIVKSHVVLLSGGPHEIITLFRTTNVPVGFPILVVDRGTVNGRTMSAENALTPGFPPPDDYVAVKRDRLNFFRIVKGSGDNRRAFLTTPPRCPASGEWTNTATFHYVDDVTQRASSPSPCEG